MSKRKSRNKLRSDRLLGLKYISGNKGGRNIAIKGDNLNALSAISNWSEPVDVIYIDPPYNVGGNFGYKNRWNGNSGQKFSWAKDHGEFLAFMDMRLRLARNVLADEGVIFVSICDQEYCHLKLLMDDIFGNKNALGTVIWDKSQGANGKHLTTIHEYILVYAKNRSRAPRLTKAKPAAELMVEKAQSLKDRKLKYCDAQCEFKRWVATAQKEGLIGSGESPYKNLHPKTYRPFQATPSCAHDNPDRRSRKQLIHPVTGKKCKVPAKGWKWSEATLKSMIAFKKVYEGDNFVIAGKMVYGKDESTVPRKLQYLDEKMHTAFPSVLSISYGGQKDLPKELSFSTPKPLNLMKELIKAYPNKNCVVLDFFAGSGSTAHAVDQLNKEDGGKRSWIVVECMESTFENVLMPRFSFFEDKDVVVYEAIKKLKEVEGGKAGSHISSNQLSKCI